MKKESTLNTVHTERLQNLQTSLSRFGVLLCMRYARGGNTKTNYGMDTTGGKEKRTPKESVVGRSTSSHDSKKFRPDQWRKERNGVWFPEDSDSC